MSASGLSALLEVVELLRSSLSAAHFGEFPLIGYFGYLGHIVFRLVHVSVCFLFPGPWFFVSQLARHQNILAFFITFL